MRKLLAEFFVSLTLWYRFAWRVWIFGILSLTLVGLAVGMTPAHDIALRYRVSEIGRFFVLVFLVGYTLNLFRRNAILFKPVSSHKRTFRIEIRHRNGRKAPLGEIVPPSWKRSLALWWGIAWRETLLFFLGMIWFQTTIAPPYPIVNSYLSAEIGSLILLLMIFTSVAAFWWCVFHPLGNTVIAVKEESRAKP